MTQEEIIRMARKAGFSVGLNDPIIYAAHERFAALVAAFEREACAMVCEEEAEEWAGRTEPHEAVVRCAAAIRARSNT